MKTQFVLIAIFPVLFLIGGLYFSGLYAQFRSRQIIGKMFHGVQKDLLEIKADYPQLANIEKAEIKLWPSFYAFRYENNCSIIINIKYLKPGGVPEAPSFSSNVNGKILVGDVFILTEPDEQGEEFKNKVQTIVRTRVKEMESGFKTKFNYYDN